MSQFEKQLPSFRLAQIQYGDDLQAIAARELGDANRWPELVWVNNLTWPYLTADEQSASASVLLYGGLIKVPAPVGVYSDSAEQGRVYERDCRMYQRQLIDNGAGDLDIVTGTDNLRQQLQHRIDTPRGQARRHPEYGCLIWRLIGRVNGPTAGALGAAYIKSALEADYRVSKVPSSVATMSGDVINATARAEAIAGGQLDLVLSAASNTTPPAVDNSGYGNNYGNDWGN